MFVIRITYKKPIEEIDKYLAEHRAFLDCGYKNNHYIASGPQNPRTGGIILSQLTDRAQLEALIKQDPFSQHDLADFEIIEFTPVKHHANFSAFIA